MYKLPQKSEKKNFIFNMLGSLTNAAVSVLLLIVVSNITKSAEISGSFSLAYSTAQMMYTICVFEMRNIQVTDAKREFSFASVSMFRILTIAAMWLFFAIFVTTKGYSGEKLYLMIILTAYMSLMSLSDLFQGNMHLNGYLSLAGKSLACEVALAAASFTVALIITKKPTIAAGFMIVAAMTWLLLYDIPFSNNFAKIRPKFDFNTQKRIFLYAIPLFLSSFAHQYIFNSPKYAIDSILSETEQSHYGYLVMPVFCINLLSIFVFRPQLITLSKNWAEKQLSAFKKTILKLYVWVVVVTAAALIGGYFLGVPVLEMVYNADLTGKRSMFMVLLFAGGFSAASTLTMTLFTTMRKQKLCLIAYAITFLFALTAPQMMVKTWGIMGAALAYLCEMVLLFTVMFISFVISIKRERV